MNSVSNEEKLLRLLTRKMVFIKRASSSEGKSDGLYRLAEVTDSGTHYVFHFVDTTAEMRIEKPCRIIFFSSSIPFLTRRPHVRIESENVVFTDDDKKLQWAEDRYVDFLR